MVLGGCGVAVGWGLVGVGGLNCLLVSPVYSPKPEPNWARCCVLQARLHNTAKQGLLIRKDCIVKFCQNPPRVLSSTIICQTLGVICLLLSAEENTETYPSIHSNISTLPVAPSQTCWLRLNTQVFSEKNNSQIDIFILKGCYTIP